jgi:protein-S-isoprenylcysteine O-methyltransferase Ste14
MTQSYDVRRPRDGGETTMGKVVAFLYGFAAYLVFFFAFLYAIGFVSGLIVPKTVDTGAVVPMREALIVNILLMSLFAVQHSVMAHRQFKEWWTQYAPKPVERSIYVLFASLALILLVWQWRPIPTVVWQVTDPQIAMVILGVSFVGWLLVLTSTFLINHFEPFGLHQVANNLAGRPMPAVRFKTPRALEGRAPPDRSRLHHRILGGAGHDHRAPAVRGGHDGLHFRRYFPGGARPDRTLWRRVAGTGATRSASQCWCRSGARRPSAFGSVIDGFAPHLRHRA